MTTHEVWQSKNNTIAFLAGLLAGVLASRILPPLVAQAAGAGRDPFDALAADHRHFRALLSEMERSSPDETLRRTQLLLRLKRALAAHALAEEDVIYPLLHDRARAEEDARHLYGEHGQIKIHMYALERLPKDDSRWAERVAALKELIGDHAEHEETVDFPKLRQVLREKGVRRLAADAQRERTLIL